MIEEGQRLQAEGKEMEIGTFEHLGNAMHNINNINTDNQSEYDDYEDSYEENSQETQSVSYKRAVSYERANGEPDGEFNVVIRGDRVRGSVNRTAPAPRQGRVDISV